MPSPPSPSTSQPSTGGSFRCVCVCGGGGFEVFLENSKSITTPQCAVASFSGCTWHLSLCTLHILCNECIHFVLCKCCMRPLSCTLCKSLQVYVHASFCLAEHQLLVLKTCQNEVGSIISVWRTVPQTRLQGQGLWVSVFTFHKTNH